MPGLDLAGPGLKHDPNWYRKAVFYEVLVRGFADSNGSGSGDFNGLISKLDYIQWLGVDCLWVPPFYASPLRDGGYDISDYVAVLPEFGTLPDFSELVAQAHARGIRIITDLAINHTSDQHPWFQASRSDPDGPYGDFYVWSDTADRYADARIIFVDTETSNWTFDPVRRQYYWHRFFSHQPDLNFDNPAVQDAIIDVLRFWLDLGIDGIRLDAIPYLFEREGTNCENLPETHGFIRRVRRIVDDVYPGRILLAEANQWPKDVVEYFGTESEPECHMAFHFPVMPRIYYAMREQRATPIIDILRDTPDIPHGAQWGTFLRNHDELTLEMVTTEERAAMYGWYAPDSRMRANIGIRRRLASLLDNSRAEIELINALLLSLPGSPYLYYGDELGMGDNIWLSDRDAVRTPMQWSPDRNAGFSTADPGKLYLPVVQSLDLPLRERQRRGAVGHVVVAAALDARDARRPEDAPGVRAGPVRPGGVRQPARPGLPAGAARRRGRGRGGRDDPLRQQPVAGPPGHAAGAARVRGRRAAGRLRRHRLPRCPWRRHSRDNHGLTGLLLAQGHPAGTPRR